MSAADLRELHFQKRVVGATESLPHQITEDDTLHALLWRSIMRAREPAVAKGEFSDRLSEYQLIVDQRKRRV